LETTPQASSESSQRFAITEFLSVDGRGLYKISVFKGGDRISRDVG